MSSWFNDSDQEEVVIYIKPKHVLNCLLVKRGNSIKVSNLVKYDLIQIDVYIKQGKLMLSHFDVCKDQGK